MQLHEFVWDKQRKCCERHKQDGGTKTVALRNKIKVKQTN